MAKDPGQRYQSADALAVDLQRWLDRNPPLGIPVRPVDRVRFQCLRRPVTVGLTVAAIALLIFVTYAAIDVAQKRADRAEDLAIAGNGLLANHVASTALLYFDGLSRPVIDKAQELKSQGLLNRDELQREDLTPDAMRDLLAQSVTGQRLENFCKEIFDYQNDPRNRLTAFTDERMRSYIFNKHGILLAHWPTTGPDNRGKLYSGRDYFKHHKDNENSSIHVSRVFKSQRDGRYKCAVSMPVRDGSAALVGVVATTIPTSSTLGPDKWGDERHQVVLVARGDTKPPRPGDDSQPYKYPILLHFAYPVDTTEEEIVEFPNGERLLDPPRGVLELDPRSERLIQPDRGYEDPKVGERWLAAFAPVGNTEFWVVVQQRYDDAISAFLQLDRALLFLATAFFLILLVSFAAAFYWLSRAQARRTA